MKISNILSRRNRILLRELIVTDFKLRYQGSALGYLWSLLKPLFLFAILYVVFGLFLRLGGNIPHFPVYLLLGIVLWGFFTEATAQGLSAIVDRGDLIRKISFPKYIIIISSTVSALINLGFNLLVVFFFMWINGVGLEWHALLLPLLIVELYVLALALAFFLSALYVKFRDISYLWEVIIQGAFYATPILYPVSVVMEKSDFAAKILMLNPVAQMIQDARYVLITPQATTTYELFKGYWYAYIPFIIVAVIIIGASIYFKKSSKYFAENV
jgi:ABC-2 type transport system permease protein